MQNDKTFKIEPLYNVGDKVIIKANGVEGTIKSVDLIHQFVTITNGENVYWSGGFNNTCCINFDEIEKVQEEESFADFAARTQTADAPKTVTYTAKEKEEMLWDAENAEHQKAIDEQNEYHR